MRTMNLKPGKAILQASDAPSQVGQQDENICDRTIASDFGSKKRKWSEDVPRNFSDVPNTPSEQGEFLSNSNFSNSNLNLSGANQDSIQCPQRSGSSIRTLDKNERINLRVQIAMISDGDGDRPIHVAVAQENVKLLRKLCALMLKAAIPLDLTNYLRQTPLHLAVMMGNAEMVTLLLKCGATVTLRDRNGNSVIHLAVKTNSKEDVLSLILSHPQSKPILNSLDHEGYGALHYSVLKNNKTAVACLHRAGARMNIIDGKSGRSALIHAILEQNTAMVSLLLECGASAEVSDYSGRSAFDLALQTSNKNVIKLLEKRLFFNEDTAATEFVDNNAISTLGLSSKRTQNDTSFSKKKRTNISRRKK